MDKQFVKDIIRWDIENWSKCLHFWDLCVDLNNKNLKCLELGARQGGPSLWLASKGNKVICSDISYDTDIDELEKAKNLHKKYNCQDKITYQIIDALDIPYENEFDIVIAKSTLGGIAEFRQGIGDLEQRVVDQIHKCLKPDGKVLFVENGRGSFFHSYLRKKLNRNKGIWKYLVPKDYEQLFSGFGFVKIQTVGFLACFGLNEKQRTILGKIDTVFDKAVPKSMRYVIMGYVEKKA